MSLNHGARDKDTAQVARVCRAIEVDLMKVIFDTTLADGPDFSSINFIAETEFEKQWLRVWAKKNVDRKFSLINAYPNYEPKNLNNPTISLQRDKA